MSPLGRSVSRLMPKPGSEQVGEGLHVQAVRLEVSQAPSLMQSFEQRFPPFLRGCDTTMPAIGWDAGLVFYMVVLSRIVS